MHDFLQILVHGSAEATEHLKMHCAKNLDLHVYAPQIEETIDVTSDLCAYKVRILTAYSL
jgi:cleavage and polyadenylation specificity factor subunit 2